LVSRNPYASRVVLYQLGGAFNRLARWFPNPGQAMYHTAISFESHTMNTRLVALVFAAFGFGAVSSAAQVPTFDHVFVIMMENKEFSDVIGSPDAPYFNELAHRYGLATNAFAVTHPSLPNYMALTSGQPIFAGNCSTCQTDAPSIADRVEASGRTWKQYLEDMTAACAPSDAHLYVALTNPFVHYSNIGNNPQRCTDHLVPLGSLAVDMAIGRLPDLVWVTPNLCSQMHDCSIATGDAWLQSMVPTILRSPAFANSALFIVWDEGRSTLNGGGHIPLLVASPFTPAGFQSTNVVSHYHVLRTILDAWGLPPLGQSVNAWPLAEFFPPPAMPPPGFASPAQGGPGSGTVNASETQLAYSGVIFPLVNGRVTFPDCSTYIALRSGMLVPAGVAPRCVARGMGAVGPAPVGPATGNVAPIGGPAGRGPAFLGPANGRLAMGTVNAAETQLVFNGATYPLVNGRVTFPDCTVYIALRWGMLIPAGTAPGCVANAGGIGGTPPVGPSSGGSAPVITSAFVGPASGGPARGTVNSTETQLVYNGTTYPLVNGRVTFPDCTVYIALRGGLLIPAGTASGCAPGGANPI